MSLCERVSRDLSKKELPIPDDKTLLKLWCDELGEVDYVKEVEGNKAWEGCISFAFFRVSTSPFLFSSPSRLLPRHSH